MHVSEVDDTYDRDAGASVDRFEVSTEDVDTVYCLSVSPQEPEFTMSSVEVAVSVTVNENRCA